MKYLKKNNIGVISSFLTVESITCRSPPSRLLTVFECFWIERQATCQIIHHYTTTPECIRACEEVGINWRLYTDARGLVTTVFLPSFTMSPLTVSIQFILDPASLPNSCGCIFVR